MLPRLRRAVETLTPGYFALVMGSGIISVGMRLTGFDLLSAVSSRSWTPSATTSSTRAGVRVLHFIAGTNVPGVRLSMDGTTASRPRCSCSRARSGWS